MAWKLFGCLGCKDPRDDNLLSSRPVDLSGEVREQESKREEVSHESCSIPTPESPTCSDLQEGSKSKDENLWVLAKARLSPEDQKRFGSGQELPIETVVEEVRTTVEAKYTEYKKGRLQIRRRKGENINVRDYFQKILKSVLQIQDIIKNVVSFDPTGHGTLSCDHYGLR
jgi:hypothetical protein